MAITILDGGMGRELAARGAPFRQPEWSALALYESPQHVEDVHADFIRAGAQIITTNSYALVPFHIGEARFTADAQRLAALSGELAKKAIAVTKQHNIKIAGSIPPLFGSYQPELFEPTQAERIISPLIKGLQDYVDIWLLETQSSVLESTTLLSLLPKDDKPIWLSLTVEDASLDANPVLRSGEPVKDAILKLLDTRVDAILFNCSQPEAIDGALEVAHHLLSKSPMQLGAYANAFSDETQGAANESVNTLRDDLNTEAYVRHAKQWAASGATLIGGCCGIGPEYIKTLATQLNPL